MLLPDFDRSVFYQAEAEAGFLRRASVKQCGKPAKIVWVDYEAPDVDMFVGGTTSRQYAIEYQDGDLPTLAEGDPVQLLDDNDVPVAKERFVVREEPKTPDDPNNDRSGYWKRALLTKL